VSVLTSILYPAAQKQDNRCNMQRRKCLARSCNSSILLVFLLVFLLIYMFAQPMVKRGFFCDDESLGHPLKTNTVPTSVLLTVSILAPILVILLIDKCLNKTSRSDVLLNMQNFIFGFFINLLFTELSKYTIGRLRPNFFAMCALDFNSIDCGNSTHPVYVTNYTCLGQNNNPFQAKNARMSFVSGHSSISCSSAVFVILYIQARAAGPLRRRLPDACYLVPLVQVLAASLALFTALTRVSDYWHHPTDVMAGALLGVIVQYWNCVYIMGLFESSESQKEMIRNKVSNSYTRCISTSSISSQTSSDEDVVMSNPQPTRLSPILP